jgi:Zn-dependent protease with chaperone function
MSPIFAQAGVLTNAEWVAAIFAGLTFVCSIVAFIYQSGKFSQRFEAHQEADRVAFEAVQKAAAADRQDLRDFMRESREDVHARLEAVSRELTELRGNVMALLRGGDR